MKVEVFYSKDCPYHQPTVVRAREVIADLGLNADIEEIEVTNQSDAEQVHFLGSPTVKVDGVDIDPNALGKKGYFLSCRLYGGSGIPPREMLERALEVSDG